MLDIWQKSYKPEYLIDQDINAFLQTLKQNFGLNLSSKSIDSACPGGVMRVYIRPFMMENFSPETLEKESPIRQDDWMYTIENLPQATAFLDRYDQGLIKADNMKSLDIYDVLYILQARPTDQSLRDDLLNNCNKTFVALNELDSHAASAIVRTLTIILTDMKNSSKIETFLSRLNADIGLDINLELINGSCGGIGSMKYEDIRPYLLKSFAPQIELEEKAVNLKDENSAEEKAVENEAPNESTLHQHKLKEQISSLRSEHSVPDTTIDDDAFEVRKGV